MRAVLRGYVPDCLLMVVLAFLFALNYELFIVKNQFAPSGFSGIGAMIEHISHMSFNLGYFSLIVNVPLCILAFFFYHKGICGKNGSIFGMLLRISDSSQNG